MKILDMYLKQTQIKQMITLEVKLWWAGKGYFADPLCNDKSNLAK